MPSSYLKFAEDFDGDGRRDIWTTPADIFASIANYMKGHGWVDGDTWGREVDRVAGCAAADCERSRTAQRHLPGDARHDRGPAGRHVAGARRPHRRGRIRCPAALPDAALVTGATRAFLVNRNYDALLEYNCSHAYAIGVGLLADRDRRRRRRRRSRRKAKARTVCQAQTEEETGMTALAADDRGVIVACPSCGQKNRLAYDRAERHVAVRAVQGRAARRVGCRSKSRTRLTSTARRVCRRSRSSWTSGRRGADRAGWWRPRSRRSPRVRPGVCSSSR